jgi:glutathione transport system permease protein
MLPYVFRRLMQAVPILLAVAALIFVMFSVIPGDFASTQIVRWPLGRRCRGRWRA